MEKYNPNKPYNTLPALPPRIKLGERVYKKTIAANKALAELKGLANVIPNQAIILNSLILKEAKDSSEIENIVTTQDELYRALTSTPENQEPAVKEVMNYRQALWYGYGEVKKKKIITTGDLVKIQKILVGNDAGIRAQPGTVLKNDKTGKIIYTPPAGKKVIEDKLRALEEFINLPDEDTDPLIKMAMIHYQFESIHPFYDGNGRAGRILNVLYLIHQGLLSLPILYMSSYIIRNRKAYYEGLDQVRSRNNWEEWICFILSSVEKTSAETMYTIREIKRQFENNVSAIRKKLPKIYSKELVETIFQQPYTRISNLEANLDISRFTASKYLKELEDAGFLESQKTGRDIIYINRPLFNLLKKGV